MKEAAKVIFGMLAIGIVGIPLVGLSIGLAIGLCDWAIKFMVGK